MPPREPFQKAADDADKERRNLSPEARGEIATAEAARRAQHAELQKDQDRRRPQEINEERASIALERLTPELTPEGTTPPRARSTAEIEFKAVKAVEDKHQQEHDAIDKAADQKIADILKPREEQERETDHDGQREERAENLPVEGHEAETGETTPENEQTISTPPEQAQQANSAQEQESTPSRTPAEERQASIDARRAAQEARDRSHDNDLGRGIE